MLSNALEYKAWPGKSKMAESEIGCKLSIGLIGHRTIHGLILLATDVEQADKFAPPDMRVQ